MEPITVLERMKNVIAVTLDVDAVEITRETTFVSLTKDSMELADLMIELEVEFNITIDDPENVLTVGDAVARAEKQ